MTHSTVRSATAVLDDVDTTVPARALEAVPAPSAGRRSVAVPATQGCVTIAVDGGPACVVRLRGALDREGIARVDAVLDAVAGIPRPIVVDVSAARTRDRRLWRVLADRAARRRDTGRELTFAGVHPDVVPDLEDASLPEAFLVFQAVCADPA